MRVAVIACMTVVFGGTALAEPPVTLTATTKGSSLEVTFMNVSKAPVTLTTHVKAGAIHYDWLTVTLKGKTGPKRTMTFIESRTKAIPIEQTIAVGTGLTRSIDLVFWSIRGDQGEPLAPDTYDLEATWDTLTAQRGPKFKLTAKTTLVIAAPVAKGCKDTRTNTTGIELLARQVGKLGTTIEVGLHNVDGVARCVYGVIKTHEQQNDWLTISFTAPDDPKPRKLSFSWARNKSFPQAYELAPGATIWTQWDLAPWATRHKIELPRSTMWATAIWDATREKDVWNGALTTSFGMRLP